MASKVAILPILCIARLGVVEVEQGELEPEPLLERLLLFRARFSDPVDHLEQPRLRLHLERGKLSAITHITNKLTKVLNFHTR